MSCYCGCNTVDTAVKQFDPYTDYPPSLQYPDVRTAFDLAMQRKWNPECGPCNAVALGSIGNEKKDKKALREQYQHHMPERRRGSLTHGPYIETSVAESQVPSIWSLNSLPVVNEPVPSSLPVFQGCDAGDNLAIFSEPPYARPFSDYPRTAVLALEEPENLWSYTSWRI